MTTSWEPRTPDSTRYDPDASFTALTFPADDRPPLLPEKPALPTGLGITRRTRFPVEATGAAALQARTVARPALQLILGAGEIAERLSRRIETCLAELVALAYTRTSGSHLLCSVWIDADHVFLAVEHDQALPRVADDSTRGLNVVKAVADDYGTHTVDMTHQTWAAVRRA